MLFGSQIDTMGIPVKGLVAEQMTAFPGVPFNGQLVHRTDQNAYYAYLGGSWVRIDNTGIVAPPDASETVKGLVELATTAEATTGTDTVRAVTPAGVAAAIAALVAAAPGALNTLDELAAALGDDPNFATTITNALAGKASTTHGHVLTDAVITGVLPVAKGGTGGVTAATARTGIGAVGGVRFSAPALVAGTWSGSILHNLGNSDNLSVSFINGQLATPAPIVLDWEPVDVNNIRIRADIAFASGKVTGAIIVAP